MNPRIVQVKPLQGYKLSLEFSNGEKGVYDCLPLLSFGIFRELKDQYYFSKVKVQDGTVAWPHGQDICPDTLYLDSKRDANQTNSAKAKDGAADLYCSEEQN